MTYLHWIGSISSIIIFSMFIFIIFKLIGIRINFPYKIIYNENKYAKLIFKNNLNYDQVCILVNILLFYYFVYILFLLYFIIKCNYFDVCEVM